MSSGCFWPEPSAVPTVVLSVLGITDWPSKTYRRSGGLLEFERHATHIMRTTAKHARRPLSLLDKAILATHGLVAAVFGISGFVSADDPGFGDLQRLVVIMLTGLWGGGIMATADLNPELARDGSFLLLRSFDTSVYRVETDWWVPRLLYAPGQFVRGLALSPGADQLMLGGTDGFVRIVDASSGQLLDQIPFEHVSDGHWLDNNHIVVGTGSTGTWGMLTLDFDEVVHRAADQLTRSFTDEECRIYRIDPCPTLEEAQSGA